MSHARGPGGITITGLIIARRRPGAASGVIFLTLEDETGTASVVICRNI
ncbi:hypothetical protein [Fuscibacter oryzae]|uniref:OB domain-containing protein n=1 Tax=Fuscibacter oryzae TaxID=2803939 RepID=A0A8J7MVG4_9RHOB|nr:hypothetical protein [Fuscibacter oryzae]MBL4928514.1 hypothetical protein [Fuscibacter oryzae]